MNSLVLTLKNFIEKILKLFKKNKITQQPKISEENRIIVFEENHFL
jgi:hypothetical protein